MRKLVIASAGFVIAACSQAQETSETDAAAAAPTPAAQPAPCQSEVYRAFDFWLGTWDVTDTAGTAAGRNIITSQEGGCLILEKWTSASGGKGQSYNFYDPGTEQWRQVWVSQGAVIDYSGGLTTSGSMRLEGEIRYHNGTNFPFTGEWTPQEDGTVRQHFEQYDPEADSWNPWFTGMYTKVDEAGD